jgi:hypothetical protein
MAFARFGTLKSCIPTLSISLTAAAAIPAFVRPARVPGFRFGFGTGFVCFGILMMVATVTFRGVNGAPY